MLQKSNNEINIFDNSDGIFTMKLFDLSLPMKSTGPGLVNGERIIG